MRVNPDTGWIDGVRRVASPNCDGRPADCAPELIVIHAIALPPEKFGGPWIEHLFTNTLDASAHPYFAQIQALRVSAHLLIQRDGGLIQFVSFNDRAWHAGESEFEGRRNCNDFSLGLELEGCDAHAFESVQYQQLAQVIRALTAAYPTLDPRRLVGHSDIAPGRKTDPGPCFEWSRLRDLLHQELS